MRPSRLLPSCQFVVHRVQCINIFTWSLHTDTSMEDVRNIILSRIYSMMIFVNVSKYGCQNVLYCHFGTILCC